MISIDDHPPPDPSSSDYQNHHQQKEVSHDLEINICEKASASASVSDLDLLKPTDAAILDDTNNPLPNFSIRDYVFGSRSKDIACNWPFSQENLQLCLKYGVKNLLPPFQSLDLLISNPSGSRFAAEKRLSDEEIVSSSDGKSKKSHPASSEKTLNTTNQTTVKKYKFFTKLNSGVEPVDQVVTPNNFIVSETMTSKVCPVCKTFSSSSNTTLNAHIDRCLSEESSMKWTANPKITVKHRIKPRKTRLMVDIYKTAPCCTVEELDRRNGTSWATNSNFPDQELEFQAEKEKKEEATFVPEVYIDTNGTKVRILSMPKVGSLDDQETRKLQKGGQGSKFIMEKKKKKAYGPKNCHKISKLIPKSKKFCSLKPRHPVSEVIGGQEENVAIEERCNKEEEGESSMKARVHKQIDDLAITRPPWACSKRTGLTKKRRSPMFTKPKEDSHLQESYEDPLDIISSQSGKFSSLKDNLSSASQERDAGSKINLKRKFSALKKSSQDPLKQKLRIEEDTSKKLSFEIVNVVEIKKKKSITSKSSSDGYSSEGLEIAFVDPLLDVESSRTEIPSHSDLQGSFMGLRNSLDDGFSKMVSRLDNKFEIENITIGHNAEDSLDPIPIPGPPGSFLPPSPGGDMVSEELHGNSSLTTTSRFHSAEDHYHHDHTNDKDSMSDSPISTVSNSSLARSDDKLFASLQDTKKSSVNANNFESFDAFFPEKVPTLSGFQNEQPCVCSRKEGVFFKNVPSYHQESQAFESNRRSSNINFNSEFFSLITRPKSPPPPPETVKSPADSSIKSPVLRLMGKNLTVVKTDDDNCSNPMNHHHRHHHLHNIRNNDHSSFFHGYPSRHPVIFNHNQNSFNPPENSRNLADLRPIMTPANCHRFDTDKNEENPPWKATKEIIVIDDSSENEAYERCNHPMNGSFPPAFYSGSFGASLNLTKLKNDDGRCGSSSMLQYSNSVGFPLASISHMRSSSSSTACYPASFL